MDDLAPQPSASDPAPEPAIDLRHLLELVLETLPTGVMVVDRAGNAVLANEASRRIWGEVIRSGEERYERSVAFWHGTRRRVEKEEWGSQRALKKGETLLNALLDFEAFDGHRRVVSCSTAPVRDEQQQIVGALVVKEDVTERVRQQEELRRLEREQRALARLSLSALEGNDVGALFEEAIALVATTLGVARGAVLEWLPDASRMDLRAGAGSWVKDVVARVEAAARFADDEVHFVGAVANVLATSIDRARVVGELREKREELRSLSRKLIEAQEAERRSIARELHDDFGQVLTALRLNLQRQATEKENLELVDGAIHRMRDLAQDLRPPQLDELGLESSLRWYVEREAARAGLGLELTLDAPPTTPAIAVATTCFRVAQEALTNVIRHAKARRVSVELRAIDARLELVVRDDGVGFDVAQARRRAARGESQGLLGMQERVELVGGELAIDSAPGRGTSVRARLPMGPSGVH